jgi:hypothetical protein
MDLDLKPGWEKKALIILAVIVVIITLYTVNPFKGNPEVIMDNQTVETPAAPVSQSPPVVTSNNTTSNNTTNIMNVSGNFQISADQAKKIATDANSGYTAGVPVKGNIMISNNNTAVWIVPLMKGSTVSKRIFVNAANGIIVGIEEVKT